MAVPTMTVFVRCAVMHNAGPLEDMYTVVIREKPAGMQTGNAQIKRAVVRGRRSDRAGSRLQEYLLCTR
jgi:hypothetical protein